MPSTRPTPRTASGAKRPLVTKKTDKRLYGGINTGMDSKNLVTGKRESYYGVGAGSEKAGTDRTIIAKKQRTPMKNQYKVVATTPNKTGSSSRAQSVSMKAYLGNRGAAAQPRKKK